MKLKLTSFDSSRNLEWLETNGLGGFASSTIPGMNSRRYHGLLVAALKPPVGRTVLLSKLEETLCIDGERYELSVNQFPGAIHPTGYQFLDEFAQDPFPVFRYRAGAVEIEKSLFLVHGENTVVVRYRQLAGPACELEIKPLIAFRDFHATTHRNDVLCPAVAWSPGQASVQPYPELPRLHFAHSALETAVTGDWYNNFEYEIERERGLDYREDLFQPFLLRYVLDPGTPAVLIASMEPHNAGDAAELESAERQRREALRTSAPVRNELVERLTLAADQFLVKRGDFKAIIAGYHWLSDWGRDSMIALPGLTLATGRFDEARDILLAFAGAATERMSPNRFPEAGEEPAYNTVDATLWFFEAARAYEAYTGDFDFIRKHLLPVLRDILDWHLNGTRYGSQCDEDGLLACGVPGVQLVWMDANAGDWVVTPRVGKPVEIQALWFNALRTMAAFCRRAEDISTAEFCEGLAALAKERFGEQFPDTASGGLCDVVMPGGVRDASIRPNQILAVSLHFPLVVGDRARSIVDLVRNELLTPMGLRTLALSDPAYKGRYEGGLAARDAAYQQGTVWPWLMGRFITAYCRTEADLDAARLQARVWLSAFEGHLNDSCWGQVSEIADGDMPHEPRGCIAQAWSVGELLRCCIEDVFVEDKG